MSEFKRRLKKQNIDRFFRVFSNMFFDLLSPLNVMLFLLILIFLSSFSHYLMLSPFCLFTSIDQVIYVSPLSLSLSVRILYYSQSYSTPVCVRVCVCMCEWELVRSSECVRVQAQECVSVCRVCLWKRERDRVSVCASARVCVKVYVFVSVCVWEKEREREISDSFAENEGRADGRFQNFYVFMCIS